MHAGGLAHKGTRIPYTTYIHKIKGIHTVLRCPISGSLRPVLTRRDLSRLIPHGWRWSDRRGCLIFSSNAELKFWLPFHVGKGLAAYAMQVIVIFLGNLGTRTPVLWLGGSRAFVDAQLVDDPNGRNMRGCIQWPIGDHQESKKRRSRSSPGW